MTKASIPLAFLFINVCLLILGLIKTASPETVLMLMGSINSIGFLWWTINNRFGVSREAEIVNKTLHQISIGNLNIEMPNVHEKNLKKIILSGKALILVLTSMIGNLMSRAKLIKKISTNLENEINVIWKNNENLLNLSQETSQWIENTEAEIQQIFSSTGEMKKAIDEIAQRASETAQITAESSTKAKETNKIIKELGQATQQISKIVETINQFAEQTNLLALNASIEAARAGEAGKGFAVVANEVKDLARETSKSAEEISKIVETIQRSVENAISSAEAITDTITNTQEYVNIVATAVEEQTAMISEIDNRIGEVHGKMEEIFNSILRTQSISEELSKLVKDLGISIYSLNDTADHLEVSGKIFQPNPSIFKEMSEIDLDIVLISMYLRHLEWQSEVIRNGIEGKKPKVVLDIKKCPFAAKLSTYTPPNQNVAKLYEHLNRVHEELHELGKVFVENYLERSLEERLAFLNEKITPTLKELERAILDFFKLYRAA